MNNKNIPQNMVNAINDPDTSPEQIIFVERVLREQLYKATDQLIKSMSAFLLFTAMWWLIKSARIIRVNLFNLEITDLNVVLLVLPIIAAFSFYQSQTSIMFISLTDSALSGLYWQKYFPFAKAGITDLFTANIFLSVENKINNSGERGFLSISTFIWTLFLFILLTFGPTFILLWMSYILIVEPAISLVWSVTSAIIVLLFVIRSNLVFFYWARGARGSVVIRQDKRGNEQKKHTQKATSQNVHRTGEIHLTKKK